MGWIQPPTLATGTQLVAGTWNTWVVDNLDWLHGASAMRLTSSDPTISASGSYADTTVTLNSEKLNTVADGHSPATSTGRLTIGQPGFYSLTVSYSFEPSASVSKLFTLLMLNDTVQLAELRLDNDSQQYLQPNLHCILPLRSGDELSVIVQHSSSSSETIGVADEYSPLVTAVWVAGIWPTGGDDPDRVVG